MILSTGETLPMILALERVYEGPMQIAGFEDVFAAAGFNDRVVGEGRRYNTAPTAGQLAVAIVAATKKSQVAADIMRNTSIPDGRAVIDALRQEQALNGVRVLDLGCGMVPGFALGAEVHTADGQSLPGSVDGMFASHTVVDFNDKAAPAAILYATGGNLDMAGETHVSYIPELPQFETPSLDSIKTIADRVLAEGGLLYSTHADLMYKA